MAWKIDKTLSFNKASTGGIAFDGRDVWVTGSDSVSVLGYWDTNSGYEGLYGTVPHPDADSHTGIEHGHLFDPEPSIFEIVNVDLASEVTGTERLGQIVKVADKMYIAVVDDLDTVVLPEGSQVREKMVKLIKMDIASQTRDSTITVTVTDAAVDLVGQNNKVWFTDSAQLEDDPNDRQQLYFYDGATFSAGVNIPVTKQYSPRPMVNGRDGWVILSSRQANGILKFDDITGAHVSTIITNRNPSAISANSDLEILVGGADGMVNTVVRSTDVSTASYGVLSAPAGCLVELDQAAHLWVGLPLIGRLDISERLVAAQDETDYDGVGSNGTFTIGTGYSASGTITLSDGSVITVDATSGPGRVTQFTVTTAGNPVVIGVTLTQSSTSGGGSAFDITPEVNNVSQDTTDNWRADDGATNDYSIDRTDITETSCIQMIKTPEFTYEWWNGASFDTRTVREYIFIRTANYVQCFRRSALYQTHNINVRMTGMVATGPELYYGEPE